MRFVALSRGEQYGPIKGITFKTNIPVEVDDALARKLLHTGRFIEVSAERVLSHVPLDDNADNLLDGFYQSNIPPRIPKNHLGTDDLNDKHICFRRFGSIGDCVFIAQVAAWIKHRYPRAKITYAVKPEYIRLFLMFDCFADVISVDESMKIDFIETCDYICLFNGVIENYGRDDRNYYDAHLERAGIPVAIKPATFPLCSVARMAGSIQEQQADTVLRANGIGDYPFVVIMLGTSNPLKTMHPKSVAKIADALAMLSDDPTHRRMRVVLLGSSIDRVVASENPWIRCVQDQPIEVAAAIVKRASLLVGGDTGLLHFAQAVGIPTVSYWGPTHPINTLADAPQEATHAVLQSALQCSPCLNLRTSFCPHFDGAYPDCMRQVPVDAINKEIQRALANSTATSPAVHDTSAGLPEMRVVSVDEAAKAFNSNVYNIAVLLDYGSTYTGGGFYTWNVARALALKGATRVTVITDCDDFIYAKGVTRDEKITIVNDKDFALIRERGCQFNLYVGTPPNTGCSAVEFAQQSRVNAKSILFVYETPNFIAKYRNGVDAKEEYWTAYKSALKKADFIWCISKEVKRNLQEWDEHFNKLTNKAIAGKVKVCSPMINEAVADKHIKVIPPVDRSTVSSCFTERARTNSIVMIARNVHYKSVEAAVEILCDNLLMQDIDGATPFVINLIGTNTKQIARKAKVEWTRRNIHIRAHENITEDEKWALLSQALLMVHPSDFEGFGIPIAEAMYAGVPVLAHPLPVFKECFASSPFYYTTDEELVKGARYILTAWADPTAGPNSSKAKLMGFLSQARAYTLRRYTTQHQIGFIHASYTRDLGDDTLHAQTKHLASMTSNDITPVRVAYITSWGNRCGIAETTRSFVKELTCGYKIFAPYEADTALVYPNDEDFVYRCWDRLFATYSKLVDAIIEYAPNVVHIQHEFSFFRNEDNFFGMIEALKLRGIRVIVTVHTFVASSFLDRLAKNVDLIITTKPHPVDDVENATCIPLPIQMLQIPTQDSARVTIPGVKADSLVVGSFGLWNQHKGFFEFLNTYNEVMIKCGDSTRYIIAGYSDPFNPYYRKARRRFADKIDQNRFILFDTYQPIADVLRVMAACDVLVFNYNVTSHASASAAIRTAMSVGKPIICTQSPMFSEFADGKEVIKVPFVEHSEGVSMPLANAIISLHEDKAMRKALSDNALAYASLHTTRNTAQAHIIAYRKLLFENGA